MFSFLMRSLIHEHHFFHPVTYDEDTVTVQLYAECSMTLFKPSKNPYRMARNIFRRLNKAQTIEEFNKIAEAWHKR